MGEGACDIPTHGSIIKCIVNIFTICEVKKGIESKGHRFQSWGGGLLAWDIVFFLCKKLELLDSN